jgi:hypothetical protein
MAPTIKGDKRMAKDDKAPEVVPEVIEPAPVADPPLEDVKVTKNDHRVKSTIGLAPGGLSHRLVDAGEIVKWEDFGVDEKERKATVERLLSLDAIEPVDPKEK